MNAEKTLSRPVARSIRRYIWLGLLGHLLWGSYPIFAKRAVAEVPKFSLLLLASLSAMFMGAAVLYWHDGLGRHQAWAILRQERALWGVVVFWVLRSVTNIVSIELTRATWIQLINILTPFPVALFGVWFFGEPVPRYTYRALILSSLGAGLMLVQDWTQVLASFTFRDLLGLVTAVFSTLALATYFQLVRRSRLRRASGGLIMFQQGVALSLAYATLSWGSGEDWHAWTAITPMGWLAVFGVIWLVQGLANLVQITAVGGANPALITSLMALRLVSALILGRLILGERLVTPAQWVGMIIVVAAVTLYLWFQASLSWDRSPDRAP